MINREYRSSYVVVVALLASCSSATVVRGSRLSTWRTVNFKKLKFQIPGSFLDAAKIDRNKAIDQASFPSL